MASKLVVKGATIELKPDAAWATVPPGGVVGAISTPTGPVFAASVPAALESDLTDGRLAGALAPISYNAPGFPTAGTLKVNSIGVDDYAGRGVLTVGGKLVLDGAKGTFKASILAPASNPNGSDAATPKSGTWTIKDAGQTAVEVG